jgi:hypothetical protein
MSGLLAKVVFSGRTRFFHKLSSLGDIVEELQKETHVIVNDISGGNRVLTERGWQELEVLGYDLSTCMGETTVVLKSFFCALPAEELEPFRLKLLNLVPALLAAENGRAHPSNTK